MAFLSHFLKGNDRFYTLWQKTHSDLIIRQDLLIQENIRDIDGIETLIELLSTPVGSTISYNSLSEDLQRDDKTVKRWLSLLEQMYIVFRVSPYSKNVTRSLKKAGKYYFYDIAKVNSDESTKLENLVALSLKSEIEFNEDVDGIPGRLYFLQVKGGHEIDFYVHQKNSKGKLIEVKLSDSAASPNFKLFEKFFPGAEKIQLVKNLDKEYLTQSSVLIKYALNYLRDI